MKIYDLAPIGIPGGANESLKFRIEILRCAGSRTFHPRVKRRETYKLEPTFQGGARASKSARWDHEIVVDDEHMDRLCEKISGRTAASVLRQVIRKIEETTLFAGKK
ncbi:MAG: hypothetical protein HKL90_09710 [Elusimicrobia bacterium]|nr:hypothetical protein [Elusimicrobiota bacterium]